MLGYNTVVPTNVTIQFRADKIKCAWFVSNFDYLCEHAVRSQARTPHFMYIVEH